ncbi:NAD(P)-binding protein [Niallia sp. Krafla_26]|uniref:NAD(P)-binding protein n=1 Tax=Niallia sp. Krafla_26 TaxID=3064703 RepID=UPI003D167660
MDYYPIQLNLKGKRAVIIGGGKIAERKVRGLLHTGADIILVSPEITDNLKESVQTGKLYWKQKSFSPEDINEAFLVIAATSDQEVNRTVKNSASPQQLVLLVDQPEDSDFILPAVLNRGKLTLTVSTSGASPTLTKKIKQSLAEQYDSRYQEYVDFLFQCRQWVLKEIDDPKIKQILLSSITEPSFLSSSNRIEDFNQLVNDLLKK